MGVYVPTSLTTPSLLASHVFFWVAGLGSAILIDAQVSRLVCCAGRKGCWAGAVVMVLSERGGGWAVVVVVAWLERKVICEAGRVGRGRRGFVQPGHCSVGIGRLAPAWWGALGSHAGRLR